MRGSLLISVLGPLCFLRLYLFLDWLCWFMCLLERILAFGLKLCMLGACVCVCLVTSRCCSLVPFFLSLRVCGYIGVSLLISVFVCWFLCWFLGFFAFCYVVPVRGAFDAL